MNAEGDQQDLLSDLSDLDLMRHLLADMHDGLDGKITRLRRLADLSGAMGKRGTMIFGGPAAYLAWVEARESYVHGNFVATVLLCQGMVEQLLAAYLNRVLKKSPVRNGFLSAQPAAFGFGSFGADGMRA